MKIENFEEIPIGVTFHKKSHKIYYLWTLIFGILTGDLNRSHINIFTFRKDKSKFKGLVAHGISTVARGEGYILKIFNFSKEVETIAKGYQNIKYLRPVLMADQIRYTYVITEKVIKENKCYCTWLVTGFNQNNKAVFTANWEIIYFLIK